MRELKPCPECQRHVAVDEQACPFCSVALTATPSTNPLVGKLTRAAIFAGALSGASALACIVQQQPPPPNEPPPPPPPQVADAGVPDQPPPMPDAAPPPPPPPAAADAGFAQPPPPADAAPIKRRIRILPNKPYGAPPARRRIV